MVKFTLCAALLSIAASAGAAIPATNDFSKLSIQPLPHRQVKTTVISTEPRESETHYSLPAIPMTAEENEYGRFGDCFGYNGITRAEEGKEALDSIVRVNLAGETVSKQTFTYNRSGLPSVCLSYLPTPQGSWELYNRFMFEYDELDRVIARESYTVESHNSDYRYEFIYTDNSPRYTSEIFYIWDETTGEMAPSQKGEYTYDSNGNLTSQIFYSWTMEDGEWLPVQKETYSWDELNRQTSFFSYIWNVSQNDWAGTEDGKCEEYFYTENGDDSLIKKYVWSDGKWVNYQQVIYTYDDKWNCTKEENLYWNREHQDWSGNEIWGANGVTYRNQYADNQYDSSDRMTRQELYQANATGEYNLIQLITNDFADLGSGNTERTQFINMRWQGPEPTLYQEKIQRFNKWGTEYYYINYSYTSGKRMPQEEDIRDIDEYNNNYGSEVYSFNSDGTRYAQLKTKYYYPSDYNPASKLRIPYESIMWQGVSRQSDQEWNPYSRTEYNWIVKNDSPLLYSSRFYRYINNSEIPVTGFDDDYDSSISMENDIYFWRDVNKNDTFYTYKINKITEYRNPDYNEGVGEWNNVSSYTEYYSYSPFEGSSVNDLTMDSNAVETARYNAAGVRLAAPAKGINIVCYSDGSVRKVVVK